MHAACLRRTVGKQQTFKNGKSAAGNYVSMKSPLCIAIKAIEDDAAP